MAALYLVLCVTVLASVLAHSDVPQAAQKACSNFDETDPCHNHCVMQYVGVIDKNGRYVESNAADFLGSQSKGSLNQEQVKKIAKNCNSLNEKKAEPGCKRTEQVFTCIDDERFKITGKHY